jgi:hypothetical protein
MANASAQTFNYTGGFQTYTVPQEVSSLQLTVTGATGGSGYLPGGIGGGSGASAQVTGFLSVTAGQQLTIGVGQAGGNATWTAWDTGPGTAGAGGSPTAQDAAGGGGGQGNGDVACCGGGGGAASIVLSEGDDVTRTVVLVMAGGGGGGGGGGGIADYNGGGDGGAGPQTGAEGGFGIN